jgi:hypothetical protein
MAVIDPARTLETFMRQARPTPCQMITRWSASVNGRRVDCGEMVDMLAMMGNYRRTGGRGRGTTWAAANVFAVL